MNNFPRYDSYKDSGVNWLDEIPAHWEVIRSKRLFQQRNERARKDDEQLTASQKFGVIFQEEFMELEGRRVTQVEFNRDILKHIEPNDFLISMRSFQGGIEFSRYRGCVSSAYVVLTPVKTIVPEYYQYLLKSDGYIRALSSTSNLVRDGQALRFENFSLVDLIVIPREEQTAIAQFLDRKLPQIDQAIAQKERLIELLQERRQILIHNAVTRGLNPNVKMKHSGVGWIGEIPEHWEMIPNKHIFKLVKNQVGKKANKYELLSLTLNGIIKRDMENPQGKFPAEFDTYQEVKKGDFVFCLFDVEETPRTVGLSNFDGMITGAYTVMQLEQGFDSRFLYYFYLNIDSDKKAKSLYKGLRNTIPKDVFFAFKSLVPPKSEQVEIADFIENINDKITTAISCKQKEIEKLKEYKAVLINSAVTGKIKVCGNSQNAEMKTNYAKSNE
jgi:type I restriction enzyme S subunit